MVIHSGVFGVESAILAKALNVGIWYVFSEKVSYRAHTRRTPKAANVGRLLTVTEALWVLYHHKKGRRQYQD